MVKLKWILLCCILALVAGGCTRGDLQVSGAIAGLPVQQAGYNIGPGLWLQPGDLALVTGAVIWMPGIDPNEIMGLNE